MYVTSGKDIEVKREQSLNPLLSTFVQVSGIVIDRIASQLIKVLFPMFVTFGIETSLNLVQPLKSSPANIVTSGKDIEVKLEQYSKAPVPSKVVNLGAYTSVNP